MKFDPYLKFFCRRNLEVSKIVIFGQKYIKNDPLFDPWPYIITQVKPIASGGLEIRNRRPKILRVL